MLLQLTVWSMWRPVQVWDVCVLQGLLVHMQKHAEEETDPEL